MNPCGVILQTSEQGMIVRHRVVLHVPARILWEDQKPLMNSEDTGYWGIMEEIHYK